MPTKAKATDTNPVSEDAIRQRAYYLWEADGRPDGRGDHYWHLAIDEMQRAAAKPAKPAAPKAEKPAKVKAEEAPKPAKAPRKSAKLVAAEAK